MTDAERAELAMVVQEAVALAISKHNPCACGLTPQVQAEVGHFFGMVRDVGAGDICNGVEIMRDNASFIKCVRGGVNKLSWVVASVIVAGVIAFMGGLVWIGFKAKAGQP